MEDVLLLWSMGCRVDPHVWDLLTRESFMWANTPTLTVKKSRRADFTTNLSKSVCSQIYHMACSHYLFVDVLNTMIGSTYRQLNELVILAAGVSPDEVDVHIAGDLVASAALFRPPGLVHQHLSGVAEFVQLVVVQPGSSSTTWRNTGNTAGEPNEWRRVLYITAKIFIQSQSYIVSSIVDVVVYIDMSLVLSFPGCTLNIPDCTICSNSLN